MKRESDAVIFSIALIILVVLSLSFVSSAGASIKLSKTEFYQLELLKAEITGSFKTPLTEANVKVYEQGKVHSSPLGNSGLLKLEAKYLYYAVLPPAIGNYSVRIENIDYYEGLKVTDAPIDENFTISSTDEPYLSFNKGFIYTTKDFEIVIKSLNAVQEVTAVFEATEQEVTKNIQQNSEKTFAFSIADIKEYTVSTLEIGDYKIPVYVLPPASQNKNDTFIPVPLSPENQTSTGGEEPETPYVAPTPQQTATCESEGGKICAEHETCVGEKSTTEGVSCCKGECKAKETSYAWIWGVFLLVILIAAGIWFFIKSKKTRGFKTEEEQLEARTKKFKDRMFPNLKPEVEVTRSLTRN